MEVFELIQWPPIPDSCYSNYKFTVNEDKFAALSLSNIGNFLNYLYSLIDLWVLEEGIGSSTERWSSTKKCACKGPSNMLQLGCIWRNEMVCSDSGMHRNTDESEGEVENDEQKAVIYLLNMTTNEFKKVAIPRGGYFFNYVDSFFKHVESLVPDGIGNIHFEEH